MSESSDTYRVELHELDAGDYVEVFDAIESDEEPVMFLPTNDAKEMAEAILAEVEQ